MTYTSFSLSVSDHVAQLVLCRPDKLNSLTIEFFQELLDVCRALERRSDVRVLVISSTGKHFTCGLDLMALGSLAADLGHGERSRAAYTFANLRARTSAEHQRSGSAANSSSDCGAWRLRWWWCGSGDRV